MTVVPAKLQEVTDPTESFTALQLDLQIGGKSAGNAGMYSNAASWGGVDNEAEFRANARRMAACWNAFHGVSIEAVEAIKSVVLPDPSAAAKPALTQTFTTAALPAVASEIGASLDGNSF